MGDLFGGSKKAKKVKVARKAKKVVTRVVKKTNVPAAKAAPLKANKAAQKAKKVVKTKKTTKKTHWASPIHEDDSSDNESEDSVDDDLDMFSTIKRNDEPAPAESAHLLDRMMGGGGGSVLRSPAPTAGAKSLLDNMMGVA